MADLFDVDVAVRQASGVGGAAVVAEVQHEQRVQDGEHVEVGHRDGCAGVGGPGAVGVTAFQEREPVGIKEAAAVGGHRQFFVVDAAVNGPAGGQQPMPGRGAGLESLGVLELVLFEGLAQDAYRVQVPVVGIVDGQQVVLFGHEQEHGSHHHGDGRFVDLVRADTGQQHSAAGAIGPRDCVHEEFDGLTDLGAEPVGDLGLGAGRLDKQCLWCVL